jgi:HK97 family phage major capsid protein
MVAAGPAQLAGQRALEKGGTASGAQLVATEKLSDSFIEILRNKMMVRAAGATILGGLVGDISIPRQTGGATAYWVAEGASPTGSTATVGQLALSPKTVGAYTDISRKMLKQSSIDVEMFVRNDLASTIAVALDAAALHGTGASNQPTGIVSTSGIGAVYAGGAAANDTNANGAELVWADIVNLETAVSVANADLGRLSYMTNAKVRGKLKQTAKVSSSDSVMVWDVNNSGSPLNGYACWATNQVRSNLTKGTSTNLSALIYGNWADLVEALWGVLDILVDPYTGSNSGTVRVNMFQDADIGVRQPGSFAAVLDAKA